MQFLIDGLPSYSFLILLPGLFYFGLDYFVLRFPVYVILMRAFSDRKQGGVRERGKI